MRTLAKYLRNYKKESILAPFFKFLEVVFDLLVPIVIAQIIDVGIAHNDHGYIVQKFFILILMAAAGLAVSITAQFFAAKASVGFATEVRQAVFDHIQKLSYTELDTLGTDTLITRLTDERCKHGPSSSSSKPVYCFRCHGDGLYHQRALCTDLRSCHPGTVPGCLCDHVLKYPSF